LPPIVQIDDSALLDIDTPPERSVDE